MDTRILVVGQYTNNRGDQAASSAMFHEIIKIHQDIRVEYLYFDTTNYLFKDNMRVKNYMLQSYGYRLNLAMMAYLLFGVKIFKWIRKIVGLIQQNDAIIFSPGGPYIGDLVNYRGELGRLLIGYIAKKHKKKIMIYGPSLGPFRNALKNILRRHLLNTFDAITVRDKESYKNLISLRIRNEIIFCGTDSSLQMNISIDEKEISRLYQKIGVSIDKKMIVGITPIDLSWHSVFGGNTKLCENLRKTLVEIIDYLIEDGNLVVLISQLYDEQNDMHLCNELKASCNNKEKVYIIGDEFDYLQQQKMFSVMDFVIGCRHHSIIFANRMNIPAITIAYEFKAESFLQELGLSKYMIWVDKLTTEELKKLISLLKKNKPQILDILKRVMPSLVDKASLHTKILEKILRQGCIE